MNLAKIKAALTGFTATRIFAAALCAKGINVTETSTQAEIEKALGDKLAAAAPAAPAQADTAGIERALLAAAKIPQAENETATAALAKHTAAAGELSQKFSVITGGLKVAGVALPEKLEVAAVNQAITEGISAQAAKLLSDHGLKEDELPLTRGENPGGAKTYAEHLLAAQEIENPGERSAYIGKNIMPLLAGPAGGRN